MSTGIRRICPRCGGTGRRERRFANPPFYLDEVEVIDCPRCEGTKSVPFGTVDLNDLKDKVDDVLDKCNDILEKVNE